MFVTHGLRKKGTNWYYRQFITELTKNHFHLEQGGRPEINVDRSKSGLASRELQADGERGGSHGSMGRYAAGDQAISAEAGGKERQQRFFFHVFLGLASETVDFCIVEYEYY